MNKGVVTGLIITFIGFMLTTFSVGYSLGENYQSKKNEKVEDVVIDHENRTIDDTNYLLEQLLLQANIKIEQNVLAVDELTDTMVIIEDRLNEIQTIQKLSEQRMDAVGALLQFMISDLYPELLEDEEPTEPQPSVPFDFSEGVSNLEV